MSFTDVEINETDPGSEGVFDAHAAAGDDYAVKLPVFEGPLDLLLHLIRQNEVEITDIPIAQISTQYLEYLQLMRDLNLDVAAEYLVMAATLALIKSRMMLPSEQEDEEGEAYDPRAELIQRLLEYERYKEVADELGQRRLLGRDVFPATATGLDPVPDSEREIEVGLFELIDAFRVVLQSAGEANVHEVETEVVSVRDRMLFVMERLEAAENVEFNRLFETEGGGIPSRPIIIATFLAILELARLAATHIYQGLGESGAPSGPIRLRRGSGFDADGGVHWRQRISELM